VLRKFQLILTPSTKFGAGIFLQPLVSDLVCYEDTDIYVVV